MGLPQEKIVDLEKQGESTEVILSTPVGKSEDGIAFVQHWSPKQRTMRAFKTLATVWGLAILAVFIPIAHFFLVPLLLILGPILATSAYGKQSIVLGGVGKCPHCAKEFEIVRASNNWPLRDVCGACHQHVTIARKT